MGFDSGEIGHQQKKPEEIVYQIRFDANVSGKHVARKAFANSVF
jgi:hypothetical protein